MGHPLTLRVTARESRNCGLRTTELLATMSLSPPPRAGFFVGRRNELRRLGELFDRGTKLVSMLGVGGTGKTSLAAHFSAQWPGEAGWVDLTECREADEVLRAVAESLSLDLGVASRADLMDAIVDHLATRSDMLIVLDNAESCPEPLAAALTRWTASEDCRWLVTSREPLRIAGEYRLPIGPLEMADALALFDHCATMVRAQPLSASEKEAAADLIVQIDCLPLAIRLAGARSNVMSPVQLRDRVADRLALLRTRDRSTVERHMTMHAAIDWSWQMLSENERLAFAQLSVIRGEFDIDAAGAVLELELAEAVERIQALVERSLLVVNTTDIARYRMFECLRDFALSKLDDDDGARARHAEHYSRLAHQLVVELPAGSGFASIVAHAPNLLAAAEYSSARDPELAAHCRLALATSHLTNGSAERWLAQCEDARALSVRAAKPALEAWALLFAARAARQVGHDDADERREVPKRALKVARGAEELRCEADLLREMGSQYFYEQRMHRAIAAYEAARACALKSGDIPRQILSAAYLAYAHWRSGQRSKARELLEPLLARIPNDSATLGVLWIAAEVALDDGDLDTAERILVTERAELGGRLHPRRSCEIPASFGEIELERGDFECARQHFHEALAKAERIGVHDIASWVHIYLGAMDLVEGDARLARQHLIQALARIESSSLKGQVALARTYLAAAWMQENPRRARELLAVARGELQSVTEHAYPLAVELVAHHADLLGEPSTESATSLAKISAALEHPENNHWIIVRIVASLLREAAFTARRRKAATPHVELRVGNDAEYFELHGEVVELARRPTIHAVFRFLVQQHEHSAQQRSTSDEIRNAGWPGERMTADSASKRVRMAISTLRKLGLKQIVVKDAIGYGFCNVQIVRRP